MGPDTVAAGANCIRPPFSGLCGVSATEVALEVDHIQPRSLGGGGDLGNLQALCYRCNAMKGNQDATDFRGLYQLHEVRAFNVGVNAGAVAGQTVMHSHIHLIPRRANDAVNPRGGVRGVIPGMQAY